MELRLVIYPAPSYEVRTWPRWNTRRRSDQWVQGRCLRCSWKSQRGETLKQIRQDVRSHIADQHPEQGEALTQTVKVKGHCIRCAGAVYGKAVNRPLFDADRPDEPTYPVHDGIGRPERLPFSSGWCEFMWTGKRTPRHWQCKEHREALRFVEAQVVEIEGRPPSDYLEGFSRWVQSNPDFEWRPQR